VRRWLPALRKRRGVRTAKEATQIAWMRHSQPWTRSYHVARHGRRWHAVHLASGGVTGPARTLEALGNLILADVQSRPVAAPGSAGWEHRTQLDIPLPRPRRGPQ
jgi:hypothetical protein